MRKRVLAVLLTAAMGCTVLAGCSDTKETTAASTKASESADKTDESKPSSEEGKVFNIYVWNDEFSSRFNDFYASKLPSDVKVNFIQTPNQDNAYQNKLDEALMNQKKAKADDKVDIFLVEADYALKYVDTPYTLDVKKDYWWPQWGYSNLANTFTRFDPENIALCDGQGGYCGLNAGPCRLYNGKSVDGSVWLKDSKSDGITAFEAKSLSLNVQQSDNPLLFADEYNDGDIPSPSTFSMKFYNAVTSPTPFIADAVVNGNNSNNLLNLSLQTL